MPAKSLPLTTREERRTQGRACRNRASRLKQADWDPARRNFDLIELFLASQKERLAELLPIKYERMSASPFGYYRGSVPVMAADMALLPNTGMHVQICGDAHVCNLGAFAAPDGSLAFDINDFDESIPAPWEWDVKRMAASLVLAGREAGNSDRQCRDAVLDLARSYREAMCEFSKMPIIDLARFQVRRHLKASPVMSALRKAERATNASSLARLTTHKNGKYRISDNGKLQYHVSKADVAKVKQGIHDYTRTLLPERRHFFNHYQVEDVAFRVVGTGSIGARDYIALMLAGAAEDPLFLQVKEELLSAWAPYLPEARVPENQGERVAEGQRAMQLQSDIFLGWTRIDERDYVVRQLRDHKAGIENEDMKGEGLTQYALVCGELLAKGHARSGDACALYGYLGNSTRFDKAMAKFGIAYADQSTKDYEQFKRALRAGKLRPSKRGSGRAKSKKGAKAKVTTA